MKHNPLEPRKVAVVASSLALGFGLIVYTDWRVQARPSEEPPAPESRQTEAESTQPHVYFPGSKSGLIGIGGESGGAFQSRGAQRKSREAEAPKPHEPDVYLGGSKSLPFELTPPDAKGPSK